MSDPIEQSFEVRVRWLVHDVFGGEHRVRKLELNGHYFVVLPHGTMATYDDCLLTNLVIAAHKYGVRAEVDNHGMRGLKILLHDRPKRKGRLWERHPSLSDLLDKVKVDA